MFVRKSICMPLLAAVSACVLFHGSADADVLDDYTNDANFLAGKYTYYPVFNSPDDFTTIVTGTLAIGTGGKKTVAHMWNAGETIKNPGDFASIDVVAIQSGTAGLYVDGDLVDPVGGRELRYSVIDGNLRFDGPWGSVDLDGTPTSALTVKVELLSVADPFLNLRATLLGDGFTDISRDFDIIASEAYFGPSAYNPLQSSRYDNLTFVPEPSSMALLGMMAGLLGLRRRKRI